MAASRSWHSCALAILCWWLTPLLRDFLDIWLRTELVRPGPGHFCALSSSYSSYAVLGAFVYWGLSHWRPRQDLRGGEGRGSSELVHGICGTCTALVFDRCPGNVLHDLPRLLAVTTHGIQHSSLGYVWLWRLRTQMDGFVGHAS